MNKNLILINQGDSQIGETDIVDAHLYDGKLHRAFTAILQNKKGEILLAKRSLKKPLWPTYWDGSFSSHPRVGETLEAACERRVFEELGVKAYNFKNLFSYTYHIKWNVVFSEWEINHILIADYDSVDLEPDPDEVSEYQWMAWEEAIKFSMDKYNQVAPWWVLAVKSNKLT